MDCHDCQKRIKTPRADYPVAELIEMLRPKCLACNPAEMPRGGRSQVEATDFTILKRKIDPCDQVPISANQADCDIRGVSPEAFDRFRVTLTDIFALPPLDLLLIQHIFNGGSFGTFSAVFIKLMEKCKRYHGSVRQMVYARKNVICEKIPQLKAVIGAIIRRDGKDAAVRREVQG